MSATRREPPMTGSKHGGIYEIESSMNIHSRVDELAQKLDKILQVLPTSTPATPMIDVCSICSSPAHTICDCPAASQFLESVHKQEIKHKFRIIIYQDTTLM